MEWMMRLNFKSEFYYYNCVCKKKIRKISRVIFGVLSLISCSSCDTFRETTREQLDQRKEPLTIKEVVGTWTGKIEFDGVMRSEKITINEDGTFNEANFVGMVGYDNAEGVTNNSGKVSFEVESTLKKNDFGETIDTIRAHVINFDFQTLYGPRRSRYVFINGNLFIPVETYFASKVILSKN
jgi:hypothetical protein